MLKAYNISIFFRCFLSLCISCNTSNDSIYKDIDNNTSRADFFKFKIPIYQSGPQKGKADWIYDYIRKQTSDLKLDTLQSGFKDIQIRIWLQNWLAIKKDLIILSRTNYQWTGELITMTYKYNDSLQEHLIVKKETKQVFPYSGWDNFFKSLLNLKILTLRDMNELPNYEVGDDGTDFVFEIATPNKYRMFHYWQPSLFLDKYWEAKNVTLIAKLLEKELLFSTPSRFLSISK